MRVFSEELAFEYMKKYLQYNVSDVVDAISKVYYKQIESWWNTLIEKEKPVLELELEKKGSAEHFKAAEFLIQVVDERNTKVTAEEKNIFFISFMQMAVFHPDFWNQNLLIYLP